MLTSPSSRSGSSSAATPRSHLRPTASQSKRPAGGRSATGCSTRNVGRPAGAGAAPDPPAAGPARVAKRHTPGHRAGPTGGSVGWNRARPCRLPVASRLLVDLEASQDRPPCAPHTPPGASLICLPRNEPGRSHRLNPPTLMPGEPDFPPSSRTTPDPLMRAFSRAAHHEPPLTAAAHAGLVPPPARRYRRASHPSSPAQHRARSPRYPKATSRVRGTPQLRSVSRLMLNRSATRAIAPCRWPVCSRISNTIRTARSRTSSGYFFGAGMTPTFARLGVSNEPGAAQFGRWSRYCPQCLAGDGSPIQNLHGGAWQRIWRLPPVFACTRHRRLLADRCPGCRQPALHLPAARGRLLPCATAEGLHPAQCRNQIGRKTAGPTLRGSARVACGHRLDYPDAGGAVDAALIGLQQRLLDLLDPGGPDHTTTFGMPIPVSRYFTDLRLLANVICATWPVARLLAVSNDLANELDAHVVERRDLIADMTQHKGRVARHTIYDRPPTGSAAAAGLLAIAEQILAGHRHDVLCELTDGPDGQRWAEHFIRAELHCSPGLVAAAAPHVARYRKRPPNGRLPAKPKAKRATRPRQPKPLPPPSAGVRPTPQPVSPLPLRAALHRFRAEHVPAFLPDDWYDGLFAHLHGIDPRLLRRGAALVMVQLTTPCRVADAAAFLAIPDEPARHAYNEVASWVRHTEHGAAFLDALHTLADQLDTAARDPDGLVDYHRRRTALASWRIPTDDWQQITDQLRRRDRHLRPFDRSDYGERKRKSASALIWIKLTGGEHRFAPHRKSPTEYRPGSVEDWGLAIDRTWWRVHHDLPGRHYPDLDRICAGYATRLAERISYPG